MLEQYQDIWINGECSKQGVRECSTRYELVKSILSKFNRPFTLLDIGSCLGYFSIRAAEDFDCTSVMVEGHPEYAKQLKEIAGKQDNKKLMVLEHLFSEYSLEELARCEHFDVVLGMSVLHHLPGDMRRNLEILQSLGDNLILELPVEESACNPGNVQKITSVIEDLKPHCIGTAPSHLDESTRPIFHLEQKKTSLEKVFYRCPHGRISIEIDANFNEKKVSFPRKGEKRDWIPGINLYTFANYGGVFPERKEIYDKLVNTKIESHHDIRPWNFIFDGSQLHPIDFADEGNPINYDDKESKEQVLDWALGIPTFFEGMVQEVSWEAK